MQWRRGRFQKTNTDLQVSEHFDENRTKYFHVLLIGEVFVELASAKIVTQGTLVSLKGQFVGQALDGLRIQSQLGCL
jgi:hypothetical protein